MLAQQLLTIQHTAAVHCHCAGQYRGRDVLILQIYRVLVVLGYLLLPKLVL